MDASDAWKSLTGADRILMTTHVKPDGDGLGSLAALWDVLAERGKQVRVVLPTPAAPKYAFLPHADRFEVLGRDVTLKELRNAFDLLVVLDTCTWNQLDGLEPLVRDHAGRLLVIDHHKTRDDLDHAELADASAAAVGMILHGMLASAGVAISPSVAEALLVSLASDTGWFRFPNVSPEVLAVAGRLVACGAQVDRIYEKLYQSETLAKVRLLGEAVATLELNPTGDVAVFHLTRKMFERVGAEPWDTENMINESQRVDGVVVSLMLVELDPTTTRVSLRSKHGVDVAGIASGFGGGGHARAAGCTVKLPLVQARSAVLDAVDRAMGRTE